MTKCEYVCNRCYIRKQYKQNYDEHIAVCEIISSVKSRKEKEMEIDSYDKIPSSSEMFAIIKHIALENQQLKKRIETLEKTNYVKRKKSMNEWLNQSENQVSVPFTTWFYNSITVNTQHLQTVFDKDLKEGIQQCFMDTIRTEIKPDSLPIRAFSNNQNKIFIYDYELATNSTAVLDLTTKMKWRTLTVGEFKHHLNQIAKKIRALYWNWESENQHLIDDDELMNERNISYRIKMMGGRITEEKRTDEIIKGLFVNLQKSIKSIVEYECSK